MINPNIAFMDRNKRTRGRPLTIKFNANPHLVTFTCSRCDYTYDITFYKGMTLFTNNLKCSNCKLEQMDYHID